MAGMQICCHPSHYQQLHAHGEATPEQLPIASYSLRKSIAKTGQVFCCVSINVHRSYKIVCLCTQHEVMKWNDVSGSTCLRSSGSPLAFRETAISFPKVRLCVAICSRRGHLCHLPCFTSA